MGIKKSHPLQRIIDQYAKGYRQKHECTCGPASLSLATGALDLGEFPRQAWLAERFKRWMPTGQFLIRGMGLHEAHFITEVLLGTRAEVSLHRAYPENKQLFREEIDASVMAGDRVVVLNFAQDHVLNRPFEGQGTPHYSAVCGFDSTKDEILIADVDPTIEAPYCCSIDRVYEAMSIQNPAFEIPRGWMVIRRRDHI